MATILGRYSLYLDDKLRTSRLQQWRAAGQLLVSRAAGSPEKRLRTGTNYLMHCADGVFSGSALARAKQDVREVIRRRRGEDAVTVARAAIIKPRVSANEPGILLVSFESELRRMLSLSRFDDLQRDYRICFMPSWQNFFSPEVLELDARATQPYYLLPSDFSEDRLAPMLGAQARILPFHAASWVNHELYCRSPVEKDIDIIMLANFHRFKRHWKLFQALADMPEGLKVVLMGVPLHGRTKADVQEEARWFGVSDRVQIIENANNDRPGDQEVLREFLERAKLLCALSYREGSYIGVAEALIANTPVAMFSNAMIGTKAYVHEKTGFLLDPNRPLSGQLMQALRAAPTLRPREWMVPNVSAQANCRRLNERLREDSLAAGNDWTVDIAGFHCIRFEVRFEAMEDAPGGAFDAEYGRIEKDFGLRLKRAAQDPRLGEPG